MSESSSKQEKPPVCGGQKEPPPNHHRLQKIWLLIDKLHDFFMFENKITSLAWPILTPPVRQQTGDSCSKFAKSCSKFSFFSWCEKKPQSGLAKGNPPNLWEYGDFWSHRVQNVIFVDPSEADLHGLVTKVNPQGPRQTGDSSKFGNFFWGVKTPWATKKSSAGSAKRPQSMQIRHQGRPENSRKWEKKNI